MAAGAAAIALRRTKELQQIFTEKGALSPETALTLQELGLEKKSGVFELMVLRKHIIENEDKYYLDNEKFDDRAIKKLHNFITGLFDELKEE